MKRSTKGSYTVEAAIILPIMIIAVLTLGFFVKLEGIWENVINGALDETHYSAMRGYSSMSSLGLSGKIEERVRAENDELSSVKVSWSPLGSGTIEGAKAYRIRADVRLPMPLEFGRNLKFEAGIKFRNFTGKKTNGNGLGREGLESASGYHKVVVFPQMGERYHSESCTYVKAKVEQRVLSGEIKVRYGACAICKSGDMADGSIVYCFAGDGTAYHRGSCRSIDRRTIVIDRTEAIEKGYTPCSKCGGG